MTPMSVETILGPTGEEGLQVDTSLFFWRQIQATLAILHSNTYPKVMLYNMIICHVIKQNESELANILF